MGLDERGQQIVRCGIELLSVKEELLDIELQHRPAKDSVRAALLEERKRQILSRVGELTEVRDVPATSSR